MATRRLWNKWSILICSFSGEESDKPEALKKVEKLIKKTVLFEECDITDKQALSKIFQKVKLPFEFHAANPAEFSEKH